MGKNNGVWKQHLPMRLAEKKRLEAKIDDVIVGPRRRDEEVSGHDGQNRRLTDTGRHLKRRMSIFFLRPVIKVHFFYNTFNGFTSPNQADPCLMPRTFNLGDQR